MLSHTLESIVDLIWSSDTSAAPSDLTDARWWAAKLGGTVSHRGEGEEKWKFPDGSSCVIVCFLDDFGDSYGSGIHTVLPRVAP